MLRIKRALISVWDKQGVVEFAKKLADLNVEIISTGKTASLLRKNGVNSQDVSDVTSFPEILSGRVKTLHPKIFGGILVNKKSPEHLEEIKNFEINPIDMVVVNLYPFSEKLKENLGDEEMLEYIDIGGVSLLRAAAKNFHNAACISSSKLYGIVLGELDKNQGFLSEETLRNLAIEAFYVTKEYDNQIYNYFQKKEVLSLNMEKIVSLRYGENSHQKASLYRLINQGEMNFKQWQGKELSFNNFLDLDAAFSSVMDFEEPCAVITKHASICGAGVSSNLGSAYKKAYLTDPLSSFGGIAGLNRNVEKNTAQMIVKSEFMECIIAPSYSPEALKIFSSKKNLRVLEVKPRKIIDCRDIRTTYFGYLIQDRDVLTLDESKMKVVTRKSPTKAQFSDLIFAWKIAKYVRSNAIVVAKKSSILGIGGGQPSRVGSVKLALGKVSLNELEGAVLASDGFFPKADSLKTAFRRGIQAVIQPGGSIKDDEIISFCDKVGMSMVFTGIRHFRH